MLPVLFVTASLLIGWRYPGMLVAAAFYGFTVGAIGGTPQATTIFVSLAVAMLMLKSLRPAMIFTVTPIDITFLLFVGWCCLSATWQPNGNQAVATSFGFASSTISIFLLFRVLGGLGDFGRRIVEMTVGFCLFGIVLTPLAFEAGVYAYGRLFIGNSPPVGLSQPIPYVALSALALVVSVRRNRLATIALAVAALSAAVAMGAATGVRGALLATGAGVGAFLAVSGGVRSRFYTVLTLLGIGLLALLLVDQMTEIEHGLLDRLLDFGRYGSTQDLSSLARYDRYRFAWYAFEHNPVAGVGIGGFTALSGYEYPHNLFLEVASKTGIVGLTLLGATLLATAARARMLLATEERWKAALFVALLVAAFVHQQFSFELAQGKGLFLIGLLAGWRPHASRQMAGTKTLVESGQAATSAFSPK